jgi:hypothetical protein
MPANYDFELGKHTRLRGSGWVGLVALFTLLIFMGVVFGMFVGHGGV